MGNSQTKNQIKGRNKKQVHWKAPERPGPPGKPELVANVDATPDVVTIKWDKPKSDGGSTLMGYLVEHRRTGSPHWVRATPLLIQVPELTLSGLEPGWRYQFRVSAQNTVGMSEPGDVSEPLTVTLQRSVITAPKFSEELKDGSALENEVAEFVVHVIGQPPPKICWFKDGFEIFSSRRTRIITENGRSVLTIHQVSLADEGEIKCTATNRAGHASTKGFVKVDAPPKIRLARQYEDGLLFELDEVIRLKVAIAGRPQPLIFWSHNGETIQNDERYEIIDTDKSSTLRVGEAKRSDRGEYQIRAVNQIGEDSTSFLVTVTDKPKPPENVKVIMTLGKSVTLSWNEPEDDGGCKIGAYIVEYFRVGWNVWLKASTCRHLTTMLNDLIEGSEYKFRVKAESPYGVSDPSDETGVIFIPDPKRGLMSPPARSRSQPRDVNTDDLPVPPKRRSASSTRNSNREQSGIIIPDTIPVRPKRDKIKSPPKTPDLSPIVKRKDTGINTNMFDRASMARELSYGVDMKPKRPDSKIEQNKLNQNKLEQNKLDTNKLEVKKESRSPSPNNRTKSPNRLNTILSSILPGKKSPSPTKKSPTPTKKSPSPKEAAKNPSPVVEKKTQPIEIPMTVQMLEVTSDRSDLYDRSPSPMERRLSLITNGNDKRSPNRSPDSGSPNKSPSPKSRRSPSPSKLSIQSNNGSRRSSMRSNRTDNDDQGSSEFMLVLYPEHGDNNYPDHDANSFAYFDLDDDMIPPPMSLSAPELGAEPPVFEPLRTSVSSSELLYERSLARFRKAAEDEEAEQANREMEKSKNDEKLKIIEEYCDERRLSIPKILINSKDQEHLIALEKKSSFKRRLSGGGSNINNVWAKRRQSLRNHVDNTDTTESGKTKINRSASPEVIQEREEQLPEKEEQLPEKVVSERTQTDKQKEMLSRQRSESEEKEEEAFAKVRAKMEKEKREIKTNAKDMDVMKEEKWISESEESEEDLSDDERFKYDTMPPLIKAQEQQTYHPRTMNMTIHKPLSKHDEPFEILTKPSPLPDPNFIPKPILKKPEDPKKLAPDKPVRKNLNESNNSLSPSPTDVLRKNRSRTPSPSPTRTVHRMTPIPTSAETQIQNSAAAAARNKRNLIRRDSEEEASVVIDYYGTIVREYGSVKRTPLEKDEEKPVEKRDILTTLDVLVKYAQSSYDEPEEIEKGSYKDILSQYSEPSSNQIVVNRYEEPKVAIKSPYEELVSRYLEQQTQGPDSLSRYQEIMARPEPQVNKRQPSPSPLKRKPLMDQNTISQEPGRQQSPSPLKRKPLMDQNIISQEPGPSSPSSTLRRSTEISKVETKRGLSRTRNLSKNRQRTATPSGLRNKLENVPSSSPPRSSPPRPLTPEQEAMQLEAEIKMRTTMDYITDVTMFIAACWVYLFNDPLWAIPILLITVYRQLKDEVTKYIPSWMKKKKQ